MLYIFLIILILLVLMFISIYNKYVNLDNENLEAFSNIGVFSQKRLDLVINLVETVKGYAKHEAETLEKVIEARSNMFKFDLKDIDKISEIQKAENELSKTLRSIMALNEAYPELKANANFLSLQEDLKNIETELERARRYYNATAKELNRYIRVFPNVLLANIFNFRKADFFEEEQEAKKAPRVSF